MALGRAAVMPQQVTYTFLADNFAQKTENRDIQDFRE